MSIERIKHIWLTTTGVAALSCVLLAGTTSIALSAAPPMIAISTTPLTVIVPTHPQVLFAVGNSNSMDSSDNITDKGNDLLTSNAPQSAIMTWSGNINLPSSLYGAAYVGLENSTSPTNYTVPTGFTPPITGGAAASSQLYTAQVDSYSVSGTTSSGNSWSCYVNTTTRVTSLGGGYTALPSPTGTPPHTAIDAWPGTLTWDPTQVWYYNGIDVGGNNGFTETTDPGPITMLYRPSAERLASRAAVPYGLSAVSPAAMLLGLNNVSYLVGSGGGGGAQPRSTGGAPPTPPACGPGSGPPVIPCVPPPTKYCHEYKWTPLTTTPYTDTYTYYGDNSASRLNIAKASISAVITNYAGTTDFGLMDYSVPTKTGYYTWAYYMSPPAGFTFSSTYSAPTGSTQYVMNPCYLATSTVSTDCNASNILAELLAANPGMTAAQLKAASHKFMLVANRSDDPSINDVFLSSSSSSFASKPAFLEDGAITTSNPPCSLPSTNSPYTGCTLGDYNAGNVQMTYSNTAPSVSYNNSMYTYPTNAGYVAYTPQVMYGARGYLWSGTASATTGNPITPVTAAPADPTPAQITTYVNTYFTPYLEPENNVPSSDTTAYPTYKNAIFASASQSPIAGMLSTALATYGPAPVGPCPPPRYVILMTDGLPTLDMSGKNWPPLGSAAAVGYGVTASFNADGSLNTTNDQALTDTITELSALNAAGIKTFVVGMGPGVNPALNPQAAAALTAMSVAGGTYAFNPPPGGPGYFPGSSPAQVVADLNAILNIISVSNVSSVSAAANTSSLNTGTTVYQASYSGYNGEFRDWTGDVQAFGVNASTGVVSTTAAWSAQCQLDALATGSAACPSTPGTGAGWNTARLVATWNPSTNIGVPFRWADISAAQQTELQPTDALGSDRLNYLRGDTAEEIHNGGADNFRNRSHILGDIVDSAPIYIGASNGPYLADPSYQTFVATTANRKMLYVGANDGMLHAIAPATGNEQYAFVPNGVFGNLVNLTSPGYDTAHQFFVDGSPSAGDVKFAGGTWHTVLTGGLNDGGQSIYALDVTTPSAITTETQAANSVLWEFSDPTLGLTYSRPVIAKTNVTGAPAPNTNPNGFLEFFGSGYNNSDGNNYLYAVNPETGKLVVKINLCAAVPGACNATVPNGLSSVVVANSGGAVGQAVDRVYAGDLQGNLWRVDISNANPASWVVTVLFTACGGVCAGTNYQPITVTPAVSLQPNFPGQTGTIVYFGTGQYLSVGDRSNVQAQSFYGVWDNNTGSTETRAQLQQQVLTTTTIGTTSVRTITNNPVNWATQFGWYMDLPLAGERVITDPRLYSGEVIFTTYVPTPGDSCVGGGAAFLMAVNYANGGSFPQPQLDINGDGVLNSSDQVGGLNPVGIGLGDVFASAPAILSASMGAIQVMKLTTLSSGTIMNVGERGGQPGQRAWWQVQ
ncbi:MAG: PilC/PilY family type IV pilus protein [Gammaproteobacteria bacterium]